MKHFGCKIISLLLLIINLSLTAQEKPISIDIKGSEINFLYRGAHYEVKVKNNTAKPINNLVISVQVPKLCQYVSSQPRAYLEIKEYTQKLGWIIHSLGVNQTITLVIDLRSQSIGQLTLEAKAFQLDPNNQLQTISKGSCQTTIFGIPRPPISTYDTEDPCKIGQKTIYVVETMNEGTLAVTNVVFSFTIPKEMEFIRAYGPTVYRYDANFRQVFFEGVSQLRPGKKIVYKVVCYAVKEGNAKFTSCMKYNEFPKPFIEEEGTSIYK